MPEKIVYRNKNTTVYKAAIFILAIIVVVLFYNFYAPSGTGNAVKSVEDVFSLLTDGKAEILAAKEEAFGLVKVTVKTGTTGSNINAQEVYVTLDGSMITTSVVKVDDYKRSLEADKAFAQCLFDSGIRVFGLLNESASVLQTQILGTFGSRVFVDCSGNVEACLQLGVGQFPTTIYNGSGYPGIRPLQAFTQLTGCAR